jgi:hypothetical protein
LSGTSRAFPPGGDPLETLVDSVTGFPRKRHSSAGAIWLRTLLLGVLLALLVPALAMAETAVAQEPATADAAATPAATEPTPAAPAADPATPAGTTAPADTTAKADTAAPADTTTPAPPPSAATRPVSPPTLVELQPGTVVTPTPTTTTPAVPAPLTPSAPTTPEVVPAALPTAPDAPRTEAPKSIVAPMPDQSTVALPTAQSAPLAVALGSGPDASAPAAPIAAPKDRALGSDAATAAAVAAGPIQSAGFTNPISLERSAPSVAAPTRRAEGPADFGPVTAPGDNPFQVHLEAQGGPAPVGSSLLAVLASYVLPGGGSLPIQSTLFLFVQLAVILAFALAPRPGSGERLVLWGLLRPQAGHRLAVRRPG